MNNQPKTCLLCAASFSLKEKELFKEWRLFECEKCRIQFWWPLKHPGKEFYEEIRDAHFFSKKALAMLPWSQRQFLKNPPFKKGKLLDIGCGSGDFLSEARKLGFDVWGFDISERMIETAKRLYALDNVYVAEPEDFVLKSDIPKFDIITIFDVLEHLTDPNAFLAIIKSLLKPGGYCVIGVPNLGRVGKKIEHWDYPPHHFFQWRKEVLKNFLEKHGLSVVRSVEQPYSIISILYEKQLLSFGIIRFFKSKQRVASVSPKFAEQVTQLADYKNLVLPWLIAPLLWPATVIGRLLKWKYSALYCVAKMP